MIHVGIDIGKSTLVTARSHPADPPHKWPITCIDLENPAWWQELRALVPSGCIVTAEPTGTHYLTPILTALTGKNAHIWQIPTTATKHIRAVHISSGKSDRTDAQALALAATWIAQGRHVHGAYPLDSELDDSVSSLRALLNNHARLTKQRTRALNQLDQLGHSMWPALVQKKDAWLRACSVGAITPDEVRDLAADADQHPAYKHGATRKALRTLADRLPPGIPARDSTRLAVQELVALVAALSAQIAANSELVTVAVLAPPYEEVTRRWMTVPYAVPQYGELPGNLLSLAALHVATRGHVLTFSIDEFKAAVGAHPKTRQSGDSITRDKVKKGYRPAMTALRMWTLTLISPKTRDNPVRRYHARLKTPYRTQAAVNKLARILWGVARDPNGYRET